MTLGLQLLSPAGILTAGTGDARVVTIGQKRKNRHEIIIPACRRGGSGQLGGGAASAAAAAQREARR
jgi:hypothetical protein